MTALWWLGVIFLVLAAFLPWSQERAARRTAAIGTVFLLFNLLQVLLLR